MKSSRVEGATVVLLVGALTALFMTGYAVARRMSASSPELLLVVWPGLLIVAFLAFALTRSASFKTNAALSLVSLVAAVYAAGLLIYLWPEPSRAREARKLGIQFDGRSKAQVVYDLREAGIEAYPEVFPTQVNRLLGLAVQDDRVLPLSGISEKTTVLCNELGEYAIFRSDEYGFRNPSGSWNTRPDILIIGDSYAIGYCVQDGEDIAGHLRAFGKQVLNLGKTSNGPILDLAVLREFGPHVRPRIVLWLYAEMNDLRNVQRELKSPIVVRYLEDPSFTQNLFHRQKEIDTLLFQYVADGLRSGHTKGILEQLHESEFARILRLYDFRRAIALAFARMKPPEPYPEPTPTFVGVLEQARDLTSSWGSEVYFVYLPAYERYSGIVRDQEEFRYRSEVLAIARKAGMQIIDVHESFSADPDPASSFFPYGLNGHYSPAGYSTAAKKILGALSAEQHATQVGSFRYSP
jgi:hypothetical protein